MRKYLALFVLLIGACTSQMKQDIAYNKDEIRLQELTLKALEIRIKNLEDENVSLKRDLEKYAQLSLNIDQQAHQIQNLFLERDLLSDEINALQDQLILMRSDWDKLQKNKGSDSTKTLSAEEVLFKEARSAYWQKKYNDALLKFSNFLKKYPRHALAAEAQFMLGETYYAGDDYAAARNEYKKVTDYFADSEKAPEAMLKTAYTYQREGRVTEATNELTRLKELYPDYKRLAYVESLLKELHDE